MIKFEDSGVSRSQEPFTLSGTCELAEDGVVSVGFTASFIFTGKMVFTGRVSYDSLIGSYEKYEDDQSEAPCSTGQMIFRKVPQVVVFHLRSVEVFVWSRARLLWQYAITAVRQQIRQWSWKAFNERRILRQRYLQLYIANVTFKMGDAEKKEFQALEDGLEDADVCYYNSVGSALVKIMPSHKYVVLRTSNAFC